MNGDGHQRGDGSRHNSSRDQQPLTGDRGGRSERGERDDRRDRDRGDRGERGDRPRRRSRSPDYRGGGRGSRRDGGGGGSSGATGSISGPGGPEADSYSSSRSHRDREREDREREDREREDRNYRRNRDPWGAGDRDRYRDRDRDRERGSRRDARRDDDDRHEGRHRRRDRERDRDRDPWGGGDRDRDRDRDRRRSGSPAAAKREPTPDLTDVVPVLERKRRLTQWDIKPPGYENVAAEQAKLSGMFPLPGAPRQQQQQPPMDLSKLQAFVTQSALPQASNSVLKPTNSRQAKRLVVSNLPADATEDALVSFFNLHLNGLNIIEGTDPCVQAQLSSDKSFALLEFREASDATVALAFDGISMEANDDTTQNANTTVKTSEKTGLTLSRPKDYIVPAFAEYSAYAAGVVSHVVVDSPTKISITNIPPYLTDEQVTELLVAFGELRAFVLAKDRSTDESRGIAFCEYAEPSSTEVAIQGLNGMDLGDRKLTVKKASIGITQVAGIEMGVNAMSMLAGTVAINDQKPDDVGISRVVQLLNMVTADELVDQEDYEEICEDVRDECARFGTVLALKVPRPSAGSRQSTGIGKIYVKFDTAESATKALKALAGRKFSDRTVVATFFPEENFEVDAW